MLRAEGIALAPNVELREPLGYLAFASAASQARVIATDSGGLQKEAYWYRVPCVTMRPSTEWVDTVEQGANVLVDDDPDAIEDGGRVGSVPGERAAALRRRSRRGADRERARQAADGQDRRGALAFARCGDARDDRPDTAPRLRTYDVAIVGAGYVGVPLAQVFAEAGTSVVLVDVDARRVGDAEPRRQLHRGRLLGEADGARLEQRASPPRPTTTSCGTWTRS